MVLKEVDNRKIRNTLKSNIPLVSDEQKVKNYEIQANED